MSFTQLSLWQDEPKKCARGLPTHLPPPLQAQALIGRKVEYHGKNLTVRGIVAHTAEYGTLYELDQSYIAYSDEFTLSNTPDCPTNLAV